MNRKIRIRKSWSGPDWWVTLPAFGFGFPQSYRFRTHAGALSWALGQLSVAGTQATNLSSEGYGPWTSRVPRW